MQKDLDDRALTERPLSSESIFEGRILHLCVDRVELPDGSMGEREYVRHVGGSAVLPLTEEGEVLCVRQYRYPFARVTTEIPAGKLNFRGEDPALAARRELREETGAICGELIPLGEMFSSPAILEERIALFLARALSFGEASPDEDEFLSVVRIPLAELCEMAMRGELPDGKTQLAVLKTAEYLRREAAAQEEQV